MSKFSKSSASLPPFMFEKPHFIPFVFMMKKMGKLDRPDADMSEWIKLDFLIDLDKTASNYSRKFAMFKFGWSEEWIKWVIAYREI
jgi:hypothetical protein